MTTNAASFGVECGACGGVVYMLACPDHEWAVASECQGCGVLHAIGDCPDCHYPICLMSNEGDLRLREELEDLHLRFACALCRCGHVFSNHRKLWGGDEPWLAWRCDTSDGCRDFRLIPQDHADD